jgi:hypothetical protein
MFLEMNPKPSRTPIGGSNRIEAALDATLAEVAQARSATEEGRRKLEAEQLRITMLVDAARKLAETLPPVQRETYLRRIEEADQSVESPQRGTLTYGRVIDFLSRKPRPEIVTPTQVRNGLRADGYECDPKTISNIMTYLVRNKRLERINWGEYRIVDEGVGLRTSVEIPGTDYAQRLTEHDIGDKE